MKSNKASRRAAIAVGATGAYLQVVEWVNLFPWNDIRSGNGQESLDLILAGVTLGLVFWLWFGGRLPAATAALGLAVWAALQATTWWIPYFTGASREWKLVYARWFDDTVSILPRTVENLPPDANHLVLHALILIAFAYSLRAYLSRERR